MAVLLGMPGFENKTEKRESENHVNKGTDKKTSKAGVRNPKRDAVGDI
ncbi:hypothetical protein [Ornithinibacillus halotolerans]|uniref:Uncharacterized protein n=1 Tax=Ornithinibacillus halotolerans TaxID=1274357 RepID=A0A916W919_9BACI|nr:hypothetical protein [Ornithinibacillus halotolerans]GGA77253.1 hypothetical protein GCM10008025_21110 [Ornithinibacillus halotolerans]